MVEITKRIAALFAGYKGSAHPIDIYHDVEGRMQGIADDVIAEGKLAEILARVDAYLPKDETGNFIAEQEKSDIVHDLLAFLAERMLEMNEQKQQEIKGFLGWLEGTALAAVYASADAFCFPSETDTFGQVILEAQASGLPVVAVNEGGPASLITDGETGRLTAATPEALADGVLYGLVGGEEEALHLRPHKLAERLVVPSRGEGLVDVADHDVAGMAAHEAFHLPGLPHRPPMGSPVRLRPAHNLMPAPTAVSHRMLCSHQTTSVRSMLSTFLFPSTACT